jgi:glutamate-1-semialdehyde aminotransferase
MCVHFQRGEIHRAADTQETDPAARALFHLEMLAAGFYLSRLGLITLSLPLTDKNYEGFLSAFDTFMETHGSILGS